MFRFFIKAQKFRRHRQEDLQGKHIIGDRGCHGTAVFFSDMPHTLHPKAVIIFVALSRDRHPVRKGYLFLTIIVDLDTKEIPDRPDGQADDTLVGILILADIFYGIIQSVSQQCINIQCRHKIQMTGIHDTGQADITPATDQGLLGNNGIYHLISGLDNSIIDTDGILQFPDIITALPFADML